MRVFAQSILIGLGLGSIYALVALGFVLVYKATRIVNLAQPGLMIAGGLLTYHFTRVVGVPFFGSLLLAALLTAVLALVLERVALRPMVGKSIIVATIITIGLDIALRMLGNRYIGIRSRQVGDPWGVSTIRFGDLVVQQRYVAMLVTMILVVVVLTAFFRYTRIGLAMRATAFDHEVALMQGISVGTVFALSWAIAGFLAAIAGTFVGTGSGIDQGSWLIALKALPAIIIGGLESLPGAVIGGLVVGIVEALVATYQSTYAPWLGGNFHLVSPYVVMLIVLLLRPYGLFGTPEVERV